MEKLVFKYVEDVNDFWYSLFEEDRLKNIMEFGEVFIYFEESILKEVSLYKGEYDGFGELFTFGLLLNLNGEDINIRKIETFDIDHEGLHALQSDLKVGGERIGPTEVKGGEYFHNFFENRFSKNFFEIRYVMEKLEVAIHKLYDEYARNRNGLRIFSSSVTVSKMDVEVDDI